MLNRKNRKVESIVDVLPIFYPRGILLSSLIFLLPIVYRYGIVLVFAPALFFAV
jgi:hypothetical protein